MSEIREIIDDVGVHLSLKDDSIECTMDDLIDAINIAIEPFGYRCSNWAEWQKFMFSCHKQYLYIKELEDRIKDMELKNG